MPRASAWFTDNDMLVELTGLASSTDSATYIQNSTGVTVSIWRAGTTSDTTKRLVNGAPMSWLSAGTYRYTAQSTSFTAVTVADRGMAIVTVNHSGLNGEWRAYWRAERRGST